MFDVVPLENVEGGKTPADGISYIAGHGLVDERGDIVAISAGGRASVAVSDPLVSRLVVLAACESGAVVFGGGASCMVCPRDLLFRGTSAVGGCRGVHR